MCGADYRGCRGVQPTDMLAKEGRLGAVADVACYGDFGEARQGGRSVKIVMSFASESSASRVVGCRY